METKSIAVICAALAAVIWLVLYLIERKKNKDLAARLEESRANNQQWLKEYATLYEDYKALCLRLKIEPK